MIDYSCPSCDTVYRHIAELIQRGGTLRYTDTSDMFPKGDIVFTCACGSEIAEQDLLETYKGATP